MTGHVLAEAEVCPRRFDDADPRCWDYQLPGDAGRTLPRSDGWKRQRICHLPAPGPLSNAKGEDKPEDEGDDGARLWVPVVTEEQDVKDRGHENREDGSKRNGMVDCQPPKLILHGSLQTITQAVSVTSHSYTPDVVDSLRSAVPAGRRPRSPAVGGARAARPDRAVSVRVVLAFAREGSRAVA